MKKERNWPKRCLYKGTHGNSHRPANTLHALWPAYLRGCSANPSPLFFPTYDGVRGKPLLGGQRTGSSDDAAVFNHHSSTNMS